MAVSGRLRIFVSAGPDLEAEREVVGETIASLPVSLGWVIKYTPSRSEPPDPALEAVAASHFYVLLMGTDITAPVGSELLLARKRSRRILPLLKDSPRTPAARVFVKDASLEWQHFRDESELGFLLRDALAEQILENALVYGITPVDWETLSALRAELKDREVPDPEQDEVTTRRRGAGSDAVIVAPGRDLPPDGVLIEPPEGRS
jgi:hypothetical protein